MRKKIIKLIVTGAVIVASLSLSGCSSKQENIVDFQAKFIACMEVELDGLYDKINGLVTDKEYVDIRRENYADYSSIKEEAFNEVKDVYEEYLDVLSVNINNYADITKDEKEKETELKGKIINVFNEINKKNDIDIELRNKKVNDYIIEFRKN